MVLFPVEHERNPEAGIYEHFIVHGSRRYSSKQWPAS